MKVLYVRNLKEVVTEEKLKEIFTPFGEIERIKKIKDYAFVHFKEREPCVKVHFRDSLRAVFKAVIKLIFFRRWRSGMARSWKESVLTAHSRNPRQKRRRSR